MTSCNLFKLWNFPDRTSNQQKGEKEKSLRPSRLMAYLLSIKQKRCGLVYVSNKEKYQTADFSKCECGDQAMTLSFGSCLCCGHLLCSYCAVDTEIP